MRTLGPLVTLSVGCLALAGCLGEASLPEPPKEPAEDIGAAPADTFAWKAAVHGPLALSFLVNPLSNQTVTCTFRVAYDDASGPNAHWSAAMLRDGAAKPGFWLVGSKFHRAQAHFIGIVDTRTFLPPQGENQRIEFDLEEFGVPAGARYTLAFAALDPATGKGNHTVDVHVSCPGAVIGDRSAGRTALLFDTSTMHAGLGASVVLPLAGAAVALWESVATGVGNEAARVFLLGLNVLAAQVDVHHPTGTARFEHVGSPGEPWPFFVHDGAAGNYEVVMTHLDADGSGLVGIIVGLDPLMAGPLPDWSAPSGHGHPCGFCA